METGLDRGGRQLHSKRGRPIPNRHQVEYGCLETEKETTSPDACEQAARLNSVSLAAGAGHEEETNECHTRPQSAMTREASRCRNPIINNRSQLGPHVTDEIGNRRATVYSYKWDDGQGGRGSLQVGFRVSQASLLVCSLWPALCVDMGSRRRCACRVADSVTRCCARSLSALVQ